jgi:outer membrane protein OmpA-like peptidoglycan-associated protein
LEGRDGESFLRSKRRADAESLAPNRHSSRNTHKDRFEQAERGFVRKLGDGCFEVDRATLRPGPLQTIDRLAQFSRRTPAAPARRDPDPGGQNGRLSNA